MYSKYPEIIMELANSHGGKLENIKKSIKFYNSLNYKNKSIKFQVFKYSDIATNDYTWFEVYKKLFLSQSTWSKILKLVNNRKSWIDIYDDYSLEILKKNLRFIYGIKIQSSILSNLKLIKKLLSINLKKLNIIINVAGNSQNEIL